MILERGSNIRQVSRLPTLPVKTLNKLRPNASVTSRETVTRLKRLKFKEPRIQKSDLVLGFQGGFRIFNTEIYHAQAV